MSALNLDAELHKAMTHYLMASNRIRVAEERDDQAMLSQAEQEQRLAAKTYEAALMKRGWRAPAAALSGK